MLQKRKLLMNIAKLFVYWNILEPRDLQMKIMPL